MLRIRAGSAVAALAWLAGAACTEDPARPGADAVFQPTEPKLLSSGSPGKDEDASVLRARDGSIYVAWFSDRGNNSDVYITRTRNGTDWDAPARVTTSVHGDFYPNLYQNSGGRFHLVWFRWEAPFRGHIWYNSSPRWHDLAAKYGRTGQHRSGRG
jgi:hypothetical protein